MVGDEHTLVAIAVQDPHDAEHVDVAVVHEGLLVGGHLAADIAEMHIGDAALPAVAIGGRVEISFGHLRERTQAVFELVGAARGEINEFLVKLGLVNEARRRADRRHRRIVGMRRERHAALLGDGQHGVVKILQAPPELLRRAGRHRAGPEPVREAHVPDHACLDRVVHGAVHADGLGATAGKVSAHASRHAGEAEIVADAGNAGRAHAADDCANIFEVLGLARTVEKDVRPVRRVKILDRGDLEAVFPGTLHDVPQVILLPQLGGIARPTPPGQVAGRLVLGGVRAALVEVIHEMDHQRLAAGLRGEAEVLVVELVAVEAEAEFHGGTKYVVEKSTHAIAVTDHEWMERVAGQCVFSHR